MKRNIVISEDGSQTIYSEDFGETYHSHSGAVMESEHIFIKNALLPKMAENEKIKILEFGFGTGLNALLTLLNASECEVEYHSLELYPLKEEEYQALNYLDEYELLQQLHCAPWELPSAITPNFTLYKEVMDFKDFKANTNSYDIVYFDAFSPSTQPELWSKEIFSEVVKSMAPGAILATYCARGIVKTALRELGLEVKRVAGVGAKRHIVVARKGIALAQ